MQEYTFKPALLRRARTWAVRDGHVLRKGADKALKLSDVTKATWGEISYRGTRNTWLHLTGPDGVTKIECGDSGNSQERETFLRFVKAVCKALIDENPDLAIRQGGGVGLKWSMFIIGLIGALFGLAFVFAGLTGQLKRGEMMAVISGGLMVAFLGLLAWNYAPWRPGLILSPREMVVLLGGMTAPMDGPDYDA